MPAGTKVDNLFQALKQKGYSVASAAKIAQAKTGLALATGKPPADGKPGRYKPGPRNAMEAGRQRYY